MTRLLPLFCCLCLIISCGKHSSPPPPGGTSEISDTVISQNLNFPWEICWGPDNMIWMTEREGKISRVDPQTGAISPLLTVSDVQSRGEGGLLGLVLHPDFNTTPHVFVVYDYDKSGTYTEKVVRYDYQSNQLVNPMILIDNIHASTNHNGSRLYISSDNKLFISTGDALNQSDPQNTGALNGKILRINLDGSIPADNPIPSNPVWTFGHRNPQGLVFANNRIYESEHGPDTDDEINILEKGRDYGWPDVKGFCNEAGEQSFCNLHQVKEPIKAWTPTIAPSGLDYYNYDAIPQWKNSLLLATLKDSRLIQLKLNDAGDGITATNEYFINEYGRIRDICISPAGNVFFCTSNGGNADKIVKLSPK